MPDPDRDHHSRFASSVALVPGGPIHGSIRPPGSKSLTNRVLICAAFSSGPCRLTGALRSEDTEVMTDALRAIGVRIDVSEDGKTLQVDPRSALNRRRGSQPVDLFVANSGTTIRFLTAALSASGGRFQLHGTPRMHQRPIGDLVDALRRVVDGTIDATSTGECPPVQMDCDGWSAGPLEVAGSVSSQFLSGLMMAAPIAAVSCPITRRLCVTGPLVSRPYVDMTAQVMRDFGAEVELTDQDLQPHQSIAVDIGPHGYAAGDHDIEPDASAASYFWAAAAITCGRIKVEGLSRGAIQGDVGFCDVLQQMGCDVEYGEDFITVEGKPLRGVDVDMNSISDTVQTLSVVALFADGPTRVRGVAHNRFKETDRIGDLARELRKLGAAVDEHADGLTITPPPKESPLRSATLETYHDHRMAMSLSLAGLRVDGVRILDPSCTSKTYPEFFADLERLIGRPHHWSSEKDDDVD